MRLQNGWGAIGSRGYSRPGEWELRNITSSGSFAEISITTPSGELVGKIRSDCQKSIIEDIEFTIDEHGCSSFKLKLNALPPFPMFAFSILQIKVGNTRYNWYSGEISYLPDEGESDDKGYEFSGSGLRNYLSTLKAKTTYATGQDVGVIVKDLVETWIAPYSPIKYNASKIQATTGVIIANAIELSSMPIETILNTLSAMASCDWGVDGDKDLYFLPQSTTIQKTMFVGYGINTFKPKWNLQEVKNVITVQRQEGAGSGGVGWAVAGIYNDPSSVKKYGRKELNYQVPGYFHDEECDIIGNALKNEKKEPAMSATVSGIPISGGNDFLQRGNYRFVMPFDQYYFVLDDMDDVAAWDADTGITLEKDAINYIYGDGSIKATIGATVSAGDTIINSLYSPLSTDRYFSLGKIKSVRFYAQSDRANNAFKFVVIGRDGTTATFNISIPVRDKFVEINADISASDISDIREIKVIASDSVPEVGTELWIDRIELSVMHHKHYELKLTKAKYKFAPSNQSADVEFGKIPPKMENYLAGLFATATELKFTTEILYGSGGGGGVTPSTKFIEGPDAVVVDGNILVWDGVTGSKAKDSGKKTSDFVNASKGVTNGDSHNHSGGDGAAIPEAGLSMADNTTGDVSTAKHGFAPKAPNDTAKYLRGDGTWAAVPAGSGESIHDISADYTITDTDGYSIINVDPSARKVTVTLPTLADNLNRKIQIIVGTAGGDVVVDGEGSETINGLASILLGGQYDNLTIIGCATEWRILSGRASIDTGWINTNDWTNRHLGTSQVAYDGKVGTFIIGETITEALSGNTGVITADSGMVLTLKNVTGTGIFTNDRQLLGGTSGATARVNESTSNKNKDTNVIHNFGYGIQRVRSHFYISEDKTEAKTYYLPSAPFWAGDTKQTMVWGVDTSQYKLQSGEGGLESLGDSGAFLVIDTEDWYYKVITEIIF